MFCTFNKLILMHTKSNTITCSAYSAQSTSLKEYKLESRAMKGEAHVLSNRALWDDSL